MRTAIAVALSLFVVGCDTNKRADNETTRYAESLKHDALKARRIEQKASAAVEQDNARLNEASHLDDK